MPKSPAIAGSAVEITVPSRFSMKRATAMISGVSKERGMRRGLAFAPLWRSPAALATAGGPKGGVARAARQHELVNVAWRKRRAGRAFGLLQASPAASLRPGPPYGSGPDLSPARR